MAEINEKMAKPKNMEKYEIYKKMKDDLKNAMKYRFYYQAIFIEYAIMEDRIASVLRHAGVPYLKDNGQDIGIQQKIDKIKGRPEFCGKFIRERLTLKLMDDLKDWCEERNRLIHHLATIPYNGEGIENIALRGKELTDKLDNKVSSVNRHLEKKQEN